MGLTEAGSSNGEFFSLKNSIIYEKHLENDWVLYNVSTLDPIQPFLSTLPFQSILILSEINISP